MNITNKCYGGSKYIFSQKEIYNMIIAYKNGESLSKISRGYKVCNDVIKRILRNNGIDKFRSFREQKNINLKYKFNNNYFESINSHEKAYFLGLLYADGYNYEECGRVSLSLQDRDIDILNYFWNDIRIEGNAPIYTTSKHKYKDRLLNGVKLINNYDTKLFRLTSKKLSNDLAKLGCFQKKSKTLKFPTLEQVPHEFINSFILGYFDGDGCISTNLCNKGYLNRKADIFILSSKSFIKSLKQFLKKNLNINCKIKKKIGCWNLHFCKSENVLNFYYYIYKNSKFFLRRKKDKFKYFFEDYKKIKLKY